MTRCVKYNVMTKMMHIKHMQTIRSLKFGTFRHDKTHVNVLIKKILNIIKDKT